MADKFLDAGMQELFVKELLLFECCPLFNGDYGKLDILINERLRAYDQLRRFGLITQQQHASLFYKTRAYYIARKKEQLKNIDNSVEMEEYRIRWNLPKEDL